MAPFSWRGWLKSWFARAPRTVVRRPRRRPALEALEDRVTPAGTFTWTGGGPTNLWSEPLIWTNGQGQNQAPTGAGDDLVFQSGAKQLSSNNDIAGADFHSLSFSGSGYFLD